MNFWSNSASLCLNIATTAPDLSQTLTNHFFSLIIAKDENVRRIMKEIEQLTEDCNKLQQISELTVSLRYFFSLFEANLIQIRFKHLNLTNRCQHQVLEDTIRDLQKDIQRQLNDRQSNDSQLSQLELTLNSP